MRSLLLFVLSMGAVAQAQPPRPPSSVVVVGFDGLSAEGLRRAQAPVLAKLRAGGAWTLRARGVMPTVSAPNWASMIMGAGPEQHGILSNEWKPETAEIPPTCTGAAAGRFPTMFWLLRQQRPDAQIAIFHHWEGFGALVEPGVPSVIRHARTAQETVEGAVAYLERNEPALLFVHLDHIDHAGHHDGHLTKEYFAAIEEGDRLLGLLLDALDRRKLRDSTAVLVTADHGGVGKKHGGNTMAELEIPWVLAGPGVRRAVELRGPVNTYDTAATVAALLALRPPECWVGRPVSEALLPLSRRPE